MKITISQTCDAERRDGRVVVAEDKKLSLSADGTLVRIFGGEAFPAELLAITHLAAGQTLFIED
jgi:hypothetical protein